MAEALTTPLPVAGLLGHARIAHVRFSPIPLPQCAAARQLLAARPYGNPCAWSPITTVQADEATVERAGAMGPFNVMRATTKPTRQLRGSHAQTQMSAWAARYRVACFTIPRVARQAALIRCLPANHVANPKCRMTREPARRRPRLAVLGDRTTAALENALAYCESWKDC